MLGMLALYLSPTVVCTQLLLCALAAQCVAAGEDVLLRSDALWETMEGIHRHGVDVRIGQVAEQGTFDTSVTLGYGIIFNWVDVWGPTYVCPTMEHFGTIGTHLLKLGLMPQPVRLGGCNILSNTSASARAQFKFLRIAGNTSRLH